MFSIPDEKGRIIQANDGKNSGNVLATYNVDFDDNNIKVSEQSKVVFSDMAGYMAAIVPYSTTGSTGDIMALSDKAYKTDFDDPTGTWTEVSAGTDPDGGNTVSDMEFFDGLLIASGTASSGTQDLLSWNGTTWVSYWKTTLGQTGFATGFRTLLKRGADGNLYFTVEGNKLWQVNPLTGAVVSGAGTLDFSATPYQFTCLGRTSTRLFIGTKNLSGGNGAIIEWDMSPSSTTANRIHDIGEEAVRCIPVKDDVAYAVLSDGTIKYFDNVSFKDYKGFRFPVEKNHKLSQDFIHPNGWDIIDDNIHLLVTGRTNASNVADSEKESYWAMPSGVWCVDPNIGLYHRFAVGGNTGTQEDFGVPALSQVGALFGVKLNSDTITKFLASYEYRLPDGTTDSVLSYHDRANSLFSRGHIITPFSLSLRDAWRQVEAFHKPLSAGGKVKVYSRSENTSTVVLSGNWFSTTVFNALATATGIVVGDIVFIKAGGGAGQWRKVIDVNESSTVTSLTFDEANTFVTADDYGLVEVFNFKYMGVIEDTTQDYHSFTLPTVEKKRKRQFLFEFIQPAATEMEIDYIMVNT